MILGLLKVRFDVVTMVTKVTTYIIQWPDYVIRAWPYSVDNITKREPKSDNRLSIFDWHELSSICLA